MHIAVVGDIGLLAAGRGIPDPRSLAITTAERRWDDLSERTRKLIIVAAVADSILKGAALIDIKRRPADQIRGPKWLWAPVVAVVNSAGLVPISYFAFERRRPPSQSG